MYPVVVIAKSFRMSSGPKIFKHSVEQNITGTMAIKMASVAVLFLVAVTIGSTSGQGPDAGCDCQCLYKSCKKAAQGKGKAAEERCTAGLNLCKRCGTEKCNAIAVKCHQAAKHEADKQRCIRGWYRCAQCMCHNKACKEHAKKTGGKDRCGESLDVCLRCDTRHCDKEQTVCMKAAKSQHDVRKCAEAWHKCGKCFCKYQRCQQFAKKHPGKPNRCNEGLKLCRQCDTAKCDAIAEKCYHAAKTPADTQKCIGHWYTCVNKSCHKK